MSAPPDSVFAPFHVGEPVEGLPAPDGARLLVPGVAGDDASARLVAVLAAIRDSVAGGATLVWSGDCMAPLGALAGMARRGVSPFVVWLDAHGDFNTWETTPSGYVGGMPLAMLTGRGDQRLVETVGAPTLADERVILADARDLDRGERAALVSSAIRVCPADELVGLERWIPAGAPVYVHLDVDVVTPPEMPAVRFPAAGGPPHDRVRSALERLAASRELVCVTVGCTWDPSKAEADRTAAAAEDLVAALSGRLPPRRD